MVTLQIPATDGYLLGAAHDEPGAGVDASLATRVVVAGATPRSASVLP